MNATRRIEGFTPNELRILWRIKRAGGKLKRDKVGNIYTYLSDELAISKAGVRGHLRDLEKASVLIRHFNRPVGGFGEGSSQLLSVEMTDPKMHLPQVEPVPLGKVIAYENNVLYEQSAQEPDAAQMLEALVDRVIELQSQIDKLQGIVEALNADNEKLRHTQGRGPTPAHLTSRIKDVLTPEAWDKLRHPEG